jgi:hypothetical protein
VGGGESGASADQTPTLAAAAAASTSRVWHRGKGSGQEAGSAGGWEGRREGAPGPTSVQLLVIPAHDRRGQQRAAIQAVPLPPALFCSMGK